MNVVNSQVLFRDLMVEEANQLIAMIKLETNHARKFQLCEKLLEIFEELDIDVTPDLSLWNEINMNYHDFLYY